jgi:hypothetical protein
MNLTYDPFPLIFSRGEAATKLACLTFFGLGDLPRARKCLLELIEAQRADGAFASRVDAAQWGMRETVRTPLLLLEAGLPAEGVNVDAAVRFLVEHQNDDGGWCENPALQLPPEQTWLSGRRSITWLSADVVDLLRRVGLAEAASCRHAVRWLRGMQTEDGGWPSVAPDEGDEQNAEVDPDATAQIAFLMADVFGEADPVHVRGRELFERHLDCVAQDAERGYWIRLRDGQREALDVYHLTHLLLSWLLDSPRRFQAGYDASDPRVRRMMDALIGLQREDGGWTPFFAEGSSPRYTCLAVEALVLSGMIDRAGLAERVRAYAT